MRERKLRNVNWRGALEQKGVKQTGVKRGRGVCPLICERANGREKFSVGCVNFKLKALSGM
jgi:hypothetical protein